MQNQVDKDDLPASGYDLRRVVETTLIPHTAFEIARNRIEQGYRHSEGASEPICLSFIGESRTGKTRVLEEVASRYPRKRFEDGLRVPILRVKTPSKPTVKSLVELMLHEIGDPKYMAGTENGKTIRLKMALKNAGTRMLMIDEFQHFYDKGSDKVMHHVADWLKILVDDARVALVVAGLPSCRAVIEQNEQLAGRFSAPVIMPRFDWANEEHREEFIAILEAFQDSLGQHFDLPRLDTEEMAFRCYCGTGGLIGYLTRFLRQLVWDVMDDNLKVITANQLCESHDKAVWAKHGLSELPNPFSPNFPCHSRLELLAKVSRIGEHVTPPAKSRRGPRKDQAETASQVLSGR